MTQKTEQPSAPRETLRVQNFAGMKDVTLELSRMNVLIGPSASGKSVCAKLLYFFKESVWRLRLATRQNKTLEEISAGETEVFLRFFPPFNWGNDNFTITYIWDDFQATITSGLNAPRTVSVTYSEPYHALKSKFQDINAPIKVAGPFPKFLGKTLVSQGRSYPVSTDELGAGILRYNYFVPEGRQFFSTIRANSFRLEEANVKLDPFMQAFGRIYEAALEEYLQTGAMEISRIELFFQLASQILRGELGQNQAGYFITHSDGRQVLVDNSSSGQQEALPLIVILWEVLAYEGVTQNAFIEEPEAHLYPTAQRDVVHLMAAVTDLFGSAEGSQYVLTTHSPYILSALNNLMYGGKIVKETPKKKDKVTAILPEQVLVDPANVRAYMMENGEAHPIIDPKTKLIEAKQLDTASGEMLREFRQLLHVEFDNLDKGAATK